MMQLLSQWDKNLFLAANSFRTVLFDAIMPVLSYTWLLWALGGMIFAFWAGMVFCRHTVWGSLRPVLFGMMLILGTAGVVDIVTNHVKVETGRLRPHQALPGVHFMTRSGWHRTPEVLSPYKQRSDSFFSGHAAHSMAVAVSAATLYPPFAPFIYAMPLAVGYSRMYLGKHYPSDVLAGWLAGGGIALLVRRLTRGPRRTLLRHTGQPCPPERHPKPANTSKA